MPNDSTQLLTVHGVLGEPRGRLLTALCGRPQTAVELADYVGTSSNAVRVHLQGLRSAGLVEYQVERRGVGKPTHVYSLTPAAEYLLSSAYQPTLRVLLDTLQEQLNGGFAPLLRKVGASLAQRSGKMAMKPSITSAVDALGALGTAAKLDSDGGERVVRSSCCPLAGVTRWTPEVCQLVEQFLTVTSGVQLRERCERAEHPRCAFTAVSRAASKDVLNKR